MLPDVTLRPVTAADIPAISNLHASVFGPGRFARAAYRVREGGSRGTFSPLCRVATQNARVVAALRMTMIAVGGVPGAALLGPLVVAPHLAGKGIGRALVSAALEAAHDHGIDLVILVGDEPYYGHFGFKPVTPPGSIVMPGPANPARILAAELAPGSLNRFRGLVTAVA